MLPTATLTPQSAHVSGERPVVSVSMLTTPAERLKHFGQEDHVRYFGADARDRIRAAGFTVEDFTAVEPLVMRYGLSRGGKIFVCRPI